MENPATLLHRLGYRLACAKVALLAIVVAGPGLVRAEEPRTGLGFAALPLVNYNSDEGVGYGLRAAVYDYGPGQEPYRYALTVQAFRTTNAIDYHRLIFDAPELLGSPWRVDGELRWATERYSPYYGLGNGATYDPDFSTCDDRDALEDDPNRCPGNPAFRGLRYYVYDTVQPTGLLNVWRRIAGGLHAFVGYRLKLVALETAYPDDLGQSTDSKLVEDWRAGEPIVGLSYDASGHPKDSRTAEAQVGVLYDTRDNEPAPTSGQFHELAIRGAGRAVGGDFTYWGAHATLRLYHALDEARRWVAAVRLLGDALAGDVPFYQLSTTGGLRDLTGLGGVDTLRGVSKNRLQGKGKLVANAELRWTYATLRPFDHELDLTVLAGLDAGRVFRELERDGPWLAGEAGAALGLRFAWDENFMVRVDYARPLSDPGSGLYVTFNHMY